MDSERIAMVSTTSGECNYWIFPSFFTYYYGKGNSYGNTLENSIIWIGSCLGYKNDDLVKILYECGAKAVIGANDSVLITYNFYTCDAFVYSLLYGNTVQKSLDFAKEIWEENDYEFWLKYANTYFGAYEGIDFQVVVQEKKDAPAEFDVYGDKNATLVTLTVEAKASLGIEEEDTNGTLSGIVTDESGNPIKGATVTAVSTLSDILANQTATTGADGSYEITCDVGNYKLKVTANGYDDYESDDVLNVETKLDTLVDTIVLTASAEVPDIVQAVLDNEDLWLDTINGETIIDGYNDCWFQDMDMDGDVEFIVGGYIGGVTSFDGTSIYSHDFLIYNYVDDELVCMGGFAFWVGLEDEYDGFPCQLYKNSDTGEFIYLNSSIDDVAREKQYYLEELEFLSDASYQKNTVVTIKVASDGSYTYYFGDDTVSLSEMLSDYDAYFANLTPYQTTVQTIPCSVSSADRDGYYDTMSDEEKLAVLTESYNAWSYTEDDSVEQPLADVVDELRDDATEDTSASETSSAKTESELKDNIAAYGDIVGWEYVDYDGDGQKEAFAVIGGEELGYTTLIAVYFIDSSDAVTQMSGDFLHGYIYSSSYTECERKGFFTCATESGGLGSQALLYSVKNGTPYELDISREIYCFWEKDGVYYTGELDYSSGGLGYKYIELIYDSTTQQFTLGDYLPDDF